MKLLVLLKSLRPSEHREFEKFLQSPYFKASDQYLKFFRYLSKRHPEFDLDGPGMREAYRRCFQVNTLPSDSQLHNLTFGMSKQLEQFLVAQLVLNPEMEDNNVPLHDQLLVKALGMRNMGAYFRSEALRLIDETVSKKGIKTDDFLTIYQLYHQIYYNPDTPKLKGDTPELQQSLQYLDLHYYVAKLRDVAEMKARERIVDVRYDAPAMLEAILEHSAALGASELFPILTIYHQLVALYQSGVDEVGFRHLMASLDTHFIALASRDRMLLIRHLINCGISLVARNCAVEAELLSLYKRAIEADILLEGKRITHSSFINIANLASLCKEFEWALGFIELFSPYLEASKKQPAVHLASAGVHYNQGMLDLAQKFLTPEIFSIPAFDIMGRGLLIKILFDRYILLGQDYEFLHHQLNAFEKYVVAQPLTLEKKQAQLNWLKFVRRLAGIKFSLVLVPEAKKEMLRKKLKDLQPMVNKKWMEERVGGL